MLFFFNDTATTEIYTLSLHDALPISPRRTTCAPGSRTTPVPSSRSRSTCARSSNGRRNCWTHRIGGPGTGEQKGSRERGAVETFAVLLPAPGSLLPPAMLRDRDNRRANDCRLP